MITKNKNKKKKNKKKLKWKPNLDLIILNNRKFLGQLGPNWSDVVMDPNKYRKR